VRKTSDFFESRGDWDYLSILHKKESRVSAWNTRNRVSPITIFGHPMRVRIMVPYCIQMVEYHLPK
jgi:hypothetical protein